MANGFYEPLTKPCHAGQPPTSPSFTILGVLFSLIHSTPKNKLSTITRILSHINTNSHYSNPTALMTFHHIHFLPLWLNIFTSSCMNDNTTALLNSNLMANKKHNFSRFAAYITRVTGRPGTFIFAILIVLVWAVTGPIFHYSDTWQLVINTGTTIITFLMVFVIQQSQNKDTLALHLKLNELIAATKGASNRLVDIEDLTEEELDILKKFYIELSELAEQEKDILASHSIDDARGIHAGKRTKDNKLKRNNDYSQPIF
jgi:low affinity Fe/Cu permease